MSEVEHKMPDRTIAVDAWAPRCPWCRDTIDDLTVPIAALQGAWERKDLTGRGDWLYHERLFSGAECACPRCAKPLLVKFVDDPSDPPSWRRQVVIAGMMTEADWQFLTEKMGPF